MHFLIDHGSKLDDEDLIFTASRYGNVTALRYLLDHNIQAAILDDNNRLPCKFACDAPQLAELTSRNKVTEILCAAYVRQAPKIRSASLKQRLFLACVRSLS